LLIFTPPLASEFFAPFAFKRGQLLAVAVLLVCQHHSIFFYFYLPPPPAVYTILKGFYSQ